MSQQPNMPQPVEIKEWIDWQPTKVLQKTVVADEAGNLLVLKRDEKRPGGRQGKWDLPGGSIGPDDLLLEGQPHEDALRREVIEETGLTVREITPVCVRSGKKNTQMAGEVFVYAVGFQCRVLGIQPTVVLSKEHIEYRWVSPDEVISVDFGENTDGFHRQTIEAFLKIKNNG